MIGTPLYVVEDGVVIGATDGFLSHHGYPLIHTNGYKVSSPVFDHVVEYRNTALMYHVVSLLHKTQDNHDANCANCIGMLE